MAIGQALRFGVNVIVGLLCLWWAVTANAPWFLRVLLLVVALVSGFVAALQLPWVRRYAERKANAA